MKLIDAIRHIDEVDGMTICARRPWRADAEVRLVRVAPMSKIPEQVINEGYEYFLEASILQEVLNLPQAKNASEEEKVHLAIYYAENDAYPPWIFGH